MKSIGIIPARYASTRFPGKPLVDIRGKSMVQRVYEQASKSLLDRVVVATDDERIFRHVKSFGGRAAMTSPFHKSGTDRCAEIAALEEFKNVELVVNIQGDEPFIQPGQVDLLVKFLMENKHFPIATLAKLIEKEKELFDPNTVKTVFDKNGKALYFSRSPMPFLKKEKKENWLAKSQFYKHIGIYGFYKNTLLEVAKLPQGRLEKAESLEQLRWLENGFPIGVQTTDYETVGIDVPADIAALPMAIEGVATKT
ncbi:MAG TPA: 3-deoxy-manno-octulosonate cytidylyltransferase [Bacteroidetes bacterium]|nr:3-deoxy-manno-octulosonate cytidylyltransferase [Bacteroidota bacterium]